MKQKNLCVIAMLMGITTVISCEEETDLKHRNEQHSTPIGSNEAGTTFISNGLLKEKLIQHAYEASFLFTTYIKAQNTYEFTAATYYFWLVKPPENAFL